MFWRGAEAASERPWGFGRSGFARSESVSDLADKHGVSRRFVYQQTHKARIALDEIFRSVTPDEGALFELVVTKAWLRQVIVGLALICCGSCRGIIEFLRDLLGVSMSVGSVRDILQSAAEKAAIINQEQKPVRHSRGPAG